MLSVQAVRDAEKWDEQVNAVAGHPFQLWEWGLLKEQTGPWKAVRLSVSDGASPVGYAQVLTRALPKPFSAICYAPRGPVVLDASRFGEVCEAVARWCKQQYHPVSLKIDPAVVQADLPDSWRPGVQVLISTTAALDLAPDAEALMKSLHSKNARNYIRRGARLGISIERGRAADLPAILDIYRSTSERDGFPIHKPTFYRTAFDTLGASSQLFVARYEGEVVAFLWNIASRGTAFELWAGATDAGRKIRANYALKWGAILGAKESGTGLYDMNGLLNDGISEFKRSFVKEETHWVGTFDRPLSPLYGLWNALLSVAKRWRRRRARQAQTQRAAPTQKPAQSQKTVQTQRKEQ